MEQELANNDSSLDARLQAVFSGVYHQIKGSQAGACLPSWHCWL
jgi:hypothetical protein